MTRRARLACRGALALFGTLLLLELVLRVLLFSDVAWIARLGAPLRRAELYASSLSGPTYWKLQNLFLPEQRPHLVPDERLGWRKEELDPATLRHRDEAALGERRAVLLFGDSFATCVVPAADCWQGLLERSELGRRYALLNYGVPGYGLDQVYLLLRATLELYAARDPVVVIGILVDDDLDRCALALRDAPKPWFTLASGELELHPPETLDCDAYLRAHPPGIWSYTWRLALIGPGLVGRARVPDWTGEGDHIALKEALTARLLVAIERELAARKIEHFYLLFHGYQELRTRRPWLWQEPFLYRQFAEHQLAFVSSKRALLEHALRTHTPLSAYFVAEGQGVNHYTAAGNAAVFESLRAGLEQRFEPYEYLAGLPAQAGGAAR